MKRMNNITSLHIFGVIIVATIGFVFRLGLIFQEKGKLPSFLNIFFLCVFCYGCAVLMTLWVIDKEWSVFLKLISIAFASFFGSVIIPGLGSIKSDFFKEIAQDFLRKWLNSKNNNNDDDSTNETSPEDDPVT